MLNSKTCQIEHLYKLNLVWTQFKWDREKIRLGENHRTIESMCYLYSRLTYVCRSKNSNSDLSLRVRRFAG